MDLYRRVRLACRHEGLSRREAARRFGIDRKTVAKLLAFSVPPGYRRSGPPRRPKREAFTGIMDRILEEDQGSHRKQRHTAKKICLIGADVGHWLQAVANPAGAS